MLGAGPSIPSAQYSANYSALQYTTTALAPATPVLLSTSFLRWDTSLQASLEMGISGTDAGMKTVALYHTGTSYTVTAFGNCEKSVTLPTMAAADPLGWTASARRVLPSSRAGLTEWLAQETSPYSPVLVNKTIWLDATSGVPVASSLVFPHTGPGGALATLTVNESWANWVPGPQPPAALAVPKACQ